MPLESVDPKQAPCTQSWVVSSSVFMWSEVGEGVAFKKKKK